MKQNKDLKIKVKEVIVERRSLSIEERLLHPYIIADPLISNYFKKIGLKNYNWDNVNGRADFETEIVRDATLEECKAWYDYQFSISHGCAVDTNKFALIKDKEIILELEEINE